MPNRILREGILTSARVDKLTESAELFYRRLHSKVDDYGRYEAHPELLRSACYPLRVDRVKAKHIIAWLEECEKAGLMVVYKVGSKSFLQLLDWRQQERAASKYPAPDARLLSNASKCVQEISDAHLVVVGVEGVVVGEIASGANAPSAAEPVDKPICLIPLNDGTEYPIDSTLAKELENLYPRVDVQQTLNEIRGWNLANPERRKTRRGVLQHINAWLAKEQNRGA